MSQVVVKVDAELDGRRLSGFPIVRRLEAEDDIAFDYEKATDALAATHTSLPIRNLEIVNALALRTDRRINLRLAGQTVAGIVLEGGGVLVLIDAVIDSTSLTNARLNNSSGTVAQVSGVALGDVVHNPHIFIDQATGAHYRVQFFPSDPPQWTAVDDDPNAVDGWILDDGASHLWLENGQLTWGLPAPVTAGLVDIPPGIGASVVNGELVWS